MRKIKAWEWKEITDLAKVREFCMDIAQVEIKITYWAGANEHELHKCLQTKTMLYF